MSAAVPSPNDPAARRVALLGELDAASEVYRAVVSHLERALAELRATGTPPSYRLLHELGDCHRLFLRLRREVIAAADGSDSVPDPSALRSLSDLSRSLTEARGSHTTRAVEPPTPAALPEDHSTPRVEQIESPVAPAVETRPAPVEAGPAPVEWVPSHLSTVAIASSMPPQTIDPETLASIAMPGNLSWAGPPIPGTGAPEPWPPMPEVRWSSREPVVGSSGFASPAAPVPRHPDEGELVALRERALPNLERVLTIRPVDDIHVPELEIALDAARALRDALNSGSDERAVVEARRLCHGDHPLAFLLKMVEGDDSLSDDDWSRLHEGVGDAFGRGLAVIAARNRLTVGDGDP